MQVRVALKSIWARASLLLLAAQLTLSGCVGTLPGNVGGPGTQIIEPPAVAGETIGSGAVRVGVLLPLSGQGNQPAVGAVFKNAAQLALDNLQGNDLTLLVKDTGGTAQGASNAARAAISEGAELLLGPVFSDSVAAAGQVARASNRALIGFSSDPTVAAPGVYLLSFLTGEDVRRVITHAGSTGKLTFAALLPNDSFGQIAEAAFRETVPAVGGRILNIMRYDNNPQDPGGTQRDVEAKARALVSSVGAVDAIFLPQGNVAPVAANALREAGLNLGTTQLLGTGVWDDPRILSAPNLIGAVFAAPDKSGFAQFAERYRERFGSQPPRTASLMSDATVLAAALVRSAGASRFSQEVLTNSDGFIGTDGVFRFTAKGLNQRGLAIYQIHQGTARVLEPAPRTFR